MNCLYDDVLYLIAEYASTYELIKWVKDIIPNINNNTIFYLRNAIILPVVCLSI